MRFTIEQVGMTDVTSTWHVTFWLGGGKIDGARWEAVVPHDDDPTRVKHISGSLDAISKREQRDLSDAAGRMAGDAVVFELIL